MGVQATYLSMTRSTWKFKTIDLPVGLLDCSGSCGSRTLAVKVIFSSCAPLHLNSGAAIFYLLKFLVEYLHWGHIEYFLDEQHVDSKIN